MTEKNTINDPDLMRFDVKDCEITTPVNPRTGQSYRFPAMNGEYTLDGAPGQESEGAKAARRVIVRHVPTGITVEEHRFLPFRNKEIALNLLQKRVEEFIQKTKEHNALKEKSKT